MDPAGILVDGWEVTRRVEVIVGRLTSDSIGRSSRRYCKGKVSLKGW